MPSFSGKILLHRNLARHPHSVLVAVERAVVRESAGGIELMLEFIPSHHGVGLEGTVIRGYVMPKGPVASEKFFWKNSVAAYRWHPRQADQPRENLS